jgi:hypothetical protein
MGNGFLLKWDMINISAAFTMRVQKQSKAICVGDTSFAIRKTDSLGFSARAPEYDWKICSCLHLFDGMRYG